MRTTEKPLRPSYRWLHTWKCDPQICDSYTLKKMVQQGSAYEVCLFEVSSELGSCGATFWSH